MVISLKYKDIAWSLVLIQGHCMVISLKYKDIVWSLVLNTRTVYGH